MSLPATLVLIVEFSKVWNQKFTEMNWEKGQESGLMVLLLLLKTPCYVLAAANFSQSAY